MFTKKKQIFSEEDGPELSRIIIQASKNISKNGEKNNEIFLLSNGNIATKEWIIKEIKRQIELINSEQNHILSQYENDKIPNDKIKPITLHNIATNINVNINILRNILSVSQFSGINFISDNNLILTDCFLNFNSQRLIDVIDNSPNGVNLNDYAISVQIPWRVLNNYIIPLLSPSRVVKIDLDNITINKKLINNANIDHNGVNVNNINTTNNNTNENGLLLVSIKTINSVYEQLKDSINLAINSPIPLNDLSPIQIYSLNKYISKSNSSFAKTSQYYFPQNYLLNEFKNLVNTVQNSNSVWSCKYPGELEVLKSFALKSDSTSSFFTDSENLILNKSIFHITCLKNYITSLAIPINFENQSFLSYKPDWEELLNVLSDLSSQDGIDSSICCVIKKYVLPSKFLLSVKNHLKDSILKEISTSKGSLESPNASTISKWIMELGCVQDISDCLSKKMIAFVKIEYATMLQAKIKEESKRQDQLNLDKALVYSSAIHSLSNESFRNIMIQDYIITTAKKLNVSQDKLYPPLQENLLNERLMTTSKNLLFSLEINLDEEFAKKTISPLLVLLTLTILYAKLRYKSDPKNKENKLYFVLPVSGKNVPALLTELKHSDLLSQQDIQTLTQAAKIARQTMTKQNELKFSNPKLQSILNSLQDMASKS